LSQVFDCPTSPIQYTAAADSISQGAETRFHALFLGLPPLASFLIQSLRLPDIAVAILPVLRFAAFFVWRCNGWNCGHFRTSSYR
ncbi:Hypothetical predicted protein, partial [Pelobates cultripes]